MTAFNGGDKLDMIPNSVVLGGTLRAFSNTSFYRLLQRIEEVRLSSNMHVHSQTINSGSS